ncbi:MAG: GAF domain-containing protein, partial [Anaerolineales bacterium]
VINNTAEHEVYQDDLWEGAIVGMPLKSGERTVGVMNVAYLQPHEFEHVELRMLQILADQAAIAIENVRLYEASESERQRVYLLHDIAQVVSQTLDPLELLQRAVTLINDNLKGESTEAFMLDPYGDRMHLLASVHPERISISDLDSRIDMRVGKGLIGWVAEHGKPILRADVRGDELWLRIPGVGENVRSALCVPVYANADLRAVIAVFHKKVGAFRSEHLDLLVSIAHQVGLALTNAERYQQINRRLSELTTLRHVAQVVNRRLNMQSLLFEVVKQVGEELGYPVVEIYLVEDDELVLRAARGSEDAIPFRLPMSQGVTGRAARMAEAIFVPDVSLDSEYVSGGTLSQCEIAVPLQKDDVVIGVLNVESPIRNDLNEDDMRLLMLLADNISIAIENAALYERLSRHAEELEATIADRTEELAEALKKAQEADRLKTQFVSDVSHELRTPLSNILLYLELLGMGKPDRFESYLETLNRETERLVVLIDDLLTVSRLDADTMEMRSNLVDLNSIARGLVEDRKKLFAEKNLQVGFELSKELPDIVADDRLLSQVVSNLMTNAMNYTPPGGCVTISTAIKKENGKRWATLSVKDTGLGITEEEKARVFQRFFRGKASRKVGTPGTGLGLAICEEIIQRHAGQISLESEEGAGSAFTIWLPLGQDLTSK